MAVKPLAGLSLDLDNLWAYLKMKGDLAKEEYPSYLDCAIPKILSCLKKHEQQITFFVVGYDAAQAENHDLMRLIALEGHELGNHSFHHKPVPKKENILRAQTAIEKATGQRPIGFRGPCFAWNQELIEFLSEQGFIYDSTTFPTFLAPAMRLYYIWKTGLNQQGQDNRQEMYGDWMQGFRSLKPYQWLLKENRKLLEIPVTTIPLMKTPFHMTYLVYLYSLSPTLMRLYLKMAIQSCLLTNNTPNFLLQRTDFLGKDLVPEMAFFPGMEISTSEKEELFDEVMTTFSKHFQFVTLSHLAETITTPKIKVAA